MPESDPIDLPKRRRERLPIVPMKPYAERSLPEKDDHETSSTARLSIESLKRIWRDIISAHREI